MSTDQHKHHRTTHWPPQLAPIGGIRFARRSSHFAETVRFYRDLVGLPLYETFEDSYGSNGAIFGLPSWNLTMEIVQAADDVAVDPMNSSVFIFRTPKHNEPHSPACTTRASNPSTSTRTGRPRAR